jgi:hypothetical protein
VNGVMDDLRGMTKELAGDALRVFLFIVIMKFFFLGWLRWMFSPLGEWDERPPVEQRPSDASANVRVYGPGEPDFISPPVAEWRRP